MMRKITVWLLTVAMVCITAVPVYASDSTSVVDNAVLELNVDANDNSYDLYKAQYFDVSESGEDIIVAGGNFAVSQSAQKGEYTDAAGRKIDSALLWDTCAGSVTYNITVEKSGMYNFYIDYLSLHGNGEDINFGLSIDGAYPFSQCESLKFPRMWKDSEEVTSGMTHAPQQIEADVFSKCLARDAAGTEILPYEFYLSAGNHTVTLISGTEPFIIAELGFTVVSEIKNYSEIKAVYEAEGYISANNESIFIEAENAVLKSSRQLVAKADGSSAKITPSDPINEYINYIGGTNWKNPNDEIIWEFEVKEEGLYRLGLCFKQDENVNAFSYRSLKIDGEIPFEECNNIRFGYGTGWQFDVIGNEQEDYLFYLEKGIHTLSLASTLGETAKYYSELKNATGELGDLYIDITMITGETPDTNRDYELFNQIPDFNERLNSISETLNGIASGMSELSGDNSTTFISSINNMVRILKSMMENPYTAQDYVKDYYNTYTTVSSWLYDMKSMPLCLDSIQISPTQSGFDKKEVSFFESVIFGVKRFVASFSEDYQTVKNNSNGKTLKIWVNWGRDQAQVLNNLINESFTPSTGIDVKLEITNATLIKGLLSDNAPDLCLNMARTEPVNLALRGALVDLTEFEDYDEIAKRFGESASIPYTYENGIYALPDTQSFYIMFYRKDILDSLGIEVPETWDEFLAATAVLQRNNMNSWIPYTQITAASTVNIGVGGLNLFSSILQQYGGSFYNEELDACALDTDVALEAFTFWTDMYTKFKIPTSASFYNRFRVGTMPLGIEVYTQYTNLTEAAPEIEGRWGIALVPGIETENGNVNHTVSGAGTGCGIVKASQNKEEAWEFLKWWTSADTQLEYNNNVESILGTVSRTTTSNLESFERMSWNGDDLEILLEQRDWIEEIPEIPGSYFVTRSVDQAFWNVVDSGERPKDMLDKWGDISTKEIQRKIEEYS